MEDTKELNKVVDKSEDIKVKWKNLYFDKSGKGHFGITDFLTIQDAKHYSNKVVKQVLEGTHFLRFPDGYNMTKAHYSWHMQLPFLGE